MCHGYPNQRGYPKMENKPAAVPLESKDPSYVPPGAYGMPQQSQRLWERERPEWKANAQRKRETVVVRASISVAVR